MLAGRIGLRDEDPAERHSEIAREAPRMPDGGAVDPLDGAGNEGGGGGRGIGDEQNEAEGQGFEEPHGGYR